MKANRPARQNRRDDQGVTDVLGAILLVGITVGMAVGLGILVMSADGPRDRIHADVAITLAPGGLSWGDGDEEVRLRHLGGESFRASEAELRIAIDGVQTTYKGAALGGGFSDGVFSVGDRLSIMTTVAVNSTVEVHLVDLGAGDLVGSTSVVASPAVASGEPAHNTYLDGIVMAVGTIADESAASDADDGGAWARLSESTVVGGSGSARRDAAAVSASSVDDPTNMLASDDADAVFDASGDTASLDGFTVPATAVSIDAVRIGFEARRGGGGSNNPVMVLDYSGPVGGGFSSDTFTISSASDVDHILNVTGDRAWTIADVEAIQVQVERQSQKASYRDARIDHVFIEVDYTEGVSSDLEATLSWSGVPVRDNHLLQIRYVTQDDTFAVDLWDGGDWNQRGTLAATDDMSVFSYNLGAGEYAGGAPQVRLRDLDTGGSPGRIDIDYARVQSI